MLAYRPLGRSGIHHSSRIGSLPALHRSIGYDQAHERCPKHNQQPETIKISGNQSSITRLPPCWVGGHSSRMRFEIQSTFGTLAPETRFRCSPLGVFTRPGPESRSLATNVTEKTWCECIRDHGSLPHEVRSSRSPTALRSLLASWSVLASSYLTNQISLPPPPPAQPPPGPLLVGLVWLGLVVLGYVWFGLVSWVRLGSPVVAWAVPGRWLGEPKLPAFSWGFDTGSGE